MPANKTQLRPTLFCPKSPNIAILLYRMKYVSSFRLSRYHICVTVVGIFLCATIHNTYTYANNDLLNQAFDESKRYDTVINPGNDK